MERTEMSSPEAGVAGAPESRSPRARGRLRLTQRGRVVMTTLVSVPLIAAAGFFALNGGGAAATGDPAAVSFRHVTIHEGESLWQVAERVAPHTDPRDVIARIVTLNQLESTTVMPGQRVAIPKQYSRVLAREPRGGGTSG